MICFGSMTAFTRRSGADVAIKSRIVPLLGLLRITDVQLQHETVELRFGQWISAFLFDRVLRRQHEKRIGQADRSVSPIVTWRSCIASSNALCTLAGARLISSARIRLEKIGPSLGRELARARIVNERADEIGRQKVRRELQALKPSLDARRQRFDGERLGQPGHAFEQNMAVGEQAEQESINEILLANNDMANLLAERRNPLA